MSRLLRLFPGAWRARYEPEVLELLRERPLGARSRLDLARGALDAHRHPELLGLTPQPWTHRLPGLLAAGAGLIWSWFWIRAYQLPSDAEWGYGAGLALLLMLIAVPGDYLGRHGRRITVAFAAIIVMWIIASVVPSNVTDGQLNATLGAAAYVLIAAGLLTLGAIRAGFGSRARWLLAVGAVLVPAAIAIVPLGGFGPDDPGGRTAMLVALLPYGLAWTLIGATMTIRGSRTISDDPTSPQAREISAT